MGDAYRWNDWNHQHIATHGVSPVEAEFVIDTAMPPYPEYIGNGKWRVRGQTMTGRHLQVIFIFDPETTVYVIHARGLNEREKRQWRRRMR